MQRPPANPESVFSFYDGFDGAQLDPARWAEARAGGIVQNGQLVLGPQAAITSAGLRAYGADTIWEAQVTFAATAIPTGTLDIWTAGGGLNEGAIGFFGSPEGLTARTFDTSQVVQLEDPLTTHVFAFVRRAMEVAFLVDGQLSFALPDQLGALQQLPVQMANGDMAVSMTYDWVRVRRTLAEEPVVSLGEIEVSSPFAPSRFSHRKLMAFRTDVFARALHAAVDERLTTTSTVPQPYASLEAEAPDREVDELLVAAVRVSGESSATGRKAGEIRANDEVLMRTAHRIDRDSSRANGYHHVAGVVDARTTNGAAKYEINLASPDAIQVDGSGAAIVVLSYPSRP
jgi:hypothetical protein